MAEMHSQCYNKHYKWLGCTASLTISRLQTAAMHGQYYNINFTTGWTYTLIMLHTEFGKSIPVVQCMPTS